MFSRCRCFVGLLNVPQMTKKCNLTLKKFSYKNNTPPEDKIILKSVFKKYALLTAASGAILMGLYSLKKRTVETGHSIVNLPVSESLSLRQKFNFIDKVVRTCAPSVVYIEIKDNNKIDPETGLPLTVSNGSGFIVDERGWIVTNAHVVINKPLSTIMVMLNDGRTFSAIVEDADMNIDLALLKINSDNKFPYLKLGKSSDVSTGEWVVALGSPLSLSHSVTAGVISSINRGAEELGLKNFSMRYIQTDAAITFGNSGGPLVNLDGDVIGINNLRVTAGIAFAIPVDYAKKFLERNNFLGNRSPSKLSNLKINLGITTIPITSDIIHNLEHIHQNVPKDLNHGVLVWKVISGTPAFLSGLMEGDIITHVNNTPIYKTSDIYSQICSIPYKLKILIIRQGEQLEVIIKKPELYDLFLYSVI